MLRLKDIVVTARNNAEIIRYLQPMFSNLTSEELISMKETDTNLSHIQPDIEEKEDCFAILRYSNIEFIIFKLNTVETFIVEIYVLPKDDIQDIVVSKFKMSHNISRLADSIHVGTFNIHDLEDAIYEIKDVASRIQSELIQEITTGHKSTEETITETLDKKRVGTGGRKKKKSTKRKRTKKRRRI